ncbi:MAG TPA: hypothetical protein VFM29_09830, partial [Vicinamibacteria bacterium]|nr:hypothetical protein [Vicinamibacteria bacterium]
FCRHGGRGSGHWRGERPYRHAYRPAPFAYAPYDHGYRYGGYSYGYVPYVPYRFGPYVRGYYGPRYRHRGFFPRPHVSLHIRLF